MKIHTIQCTTEEFNGHLAAASLVTVEKLIALGHLSEEQGKEFVDTYTVMAVSSQSLGSRLRRLLFNSEGSDDRSRIVAVKIRDAGDSAYE